MSIVDLFIELHNEGYKDSMKKLNYDIYFDETNNIRIARLTPSGTNTNIEHNFFVLGGIAITKNTYLEKDLLYKCLNLQKNLKELKFKNLCPHRENFINIIKSKKLLSFFRYLKSSNAYIHFHALHFLYWALVDIIDSLFDEPDINHEIYLTYCNQLKSDFIEVLCKDYNKLLTILYQFSFPNLRTLSQYSTISSLWVMNIIVLPFIAELSLCIRRCSVSESSADENSSNNRMLPGLRRARATAIL